MYQLDIGIGWNALKTRFQSYDQNPNVADWSRIEQHRVVLNKDIMDYYIKNAESDETVDTDRVRNYISYIFASHQKSSVSKACGDSIKVIFGNHFAKQPSEGVIIFGDENEKCSRKKCKNMYDINDGVFTDNSSYISMHSPTNSITALYNEDVSKYIQLIKHIVKDQKVVNFIDPYIASNDSSRNAFCNIYMPMISSGAVVNAFLSESEGLLYWKDLKNKALSRGIKLVIYPCAEKPIHDRFITTEDIKLTIGTGILFFNSSNKFREVCHFVYERKRPSINLDIERDLAGGIVRPPV